jgi:hypothetical protein
MSMVVINSERHATQLMIEGFLGCAKFDEVIDKRQNFKDYKVLYSQVASLRHCVEQDAFTFYERAVQSLFEAIYGINSGLEGWPIIKLYYSIFFLLRCELALNHIALIRSPDIHYLRCDPNQLLTPVLKKCRGSDHKAVIFTFKQLLGDADILSSQLIDEMYPYTWMGELREWVNYKSNSFPEAGNISHFFSKSIMDIEDQIAMFLIDHEPYFCFDADYAALALPIKRAQHTSRNLGNFNFKSSESLRSIFRRLKPSCKPLLKLEFLLLS